MWWKLNLNHCIKDILIYLIALSDLNVCFPGVIIGIYQAFLINIFTAWVVVFSSRDGFIREVGL